MKLSKKPPKFTAIQKRVVIGLLTSMFWLCRIFLATLVPARQDTKEIPIVIAANPSQTSKPHFL